MDRIASQPAPPAPTEASTHRTYGTKRKLQEPGAVTSSNAVEALPLRSFESASSVSSSASAGSVLLGVKVIWVAPTQRRQSIARRLLDSARGSFVYGTVVPQRDLAFSQPTQAGFAFAKAYCHSDSVMVYA